jgi:hypothetical protein
VAVAAAVKVARVEAIAAGAPQQCKALPAKFFEQRRKVRDDQGSETRALSGQRDGRGAEADVCRGGGTGGRESGAVAAEGAFGSFSVETEGAGGGGLAGIAGDGSGPEASTVGAQSPPPHARAARRALRLDSTVLTLDFKDCSAAFPRDFVSLVVGVDFGESSGFRPAGDT